jgi:hypothetical protein
MNQPTSEYGKTDGDLIRRAQRQTHRAKAVQKKAREEQKKQEQKKHESEVIQKQ